MTRPHGAPIIHLHTSGRYDRSVIDWHDAVRRWVRVHHCCLATATEATSGRAQAFALPDWRYVTGGDALAAHDTERWERLLFLRDHIGKARKRDAHAVSEVLKDRLTGDVLLLSSTHLRAKVESAGRWRTIAAANEWRASVRGWKKHLRRVRREAKREGVRIRHRILAADWNLDLDKPQWRALLRGLFPSMRLAVPRGCTKGTHGHRHIDAALISRRLRLVELDVLAKDESSDHRAVVGTYRITPRRKS